MNAKSLFRVFAIAAVLALCPMLAGRAAAQPASEHVSLTGVVSCTSCMMPNACKAQTQLACTQWWVSQGASFVLVVNGKVHRLSGSDKSLLKFAGQTVTVTGDLNGTEVAVATVDAVSNGKTVRE